MKYLKGIIFTLILSLISYYLSTINFFRHYQISSLVICIILGMIIGNIAGSRIPKSAEIGIKFSQQKLLRLGIVLYGFFITFQQIISVGSVGLITDLIIISVTFVGGSYIGIKFLKMEKEAAMLTAVGSSICGAAAILGTEPVLKPKPHHTAVAVATVVIFGTLGMFVYPLIYHVFAVNDTIMGIYTGATIHEVAQVVAAANAMSHGISVTAVIVKLTRVMMLAPFLMILSYYLTRNRANLSGEKVKITIPWFAIFFVVAAGINSTHIIPVAVVGILTKASVFLLTMAMGALGLDTNINKIRGVGIKPIILATILWIWLIVGGYFVTNLVSTGIHLL
ncbi:YeiH family protein [Vibrio spartinae]|uniref:Uncharacterized protein n=1 Tax=Vibrio spartinae TaxID=1918945 RepID=A0A1N6M7S9_9VIBR|nr:YeiH family protein [Vibrio spartinae]SIO95406.1 hypothetical protein VSP9026_03149 [Vibrio spartinae]